MNKIFNKPIQLGNRSKYVRAVIGDFGLQNNKGVGVGAVAIKESIYQLLKSLTKNISDENKQKLKYILSNMPIWKETSFEYKKANTPSFPLYQNIEEAYKSNFENETTYTNADKSQKIITGKYDVFTFGENDEPSVKNQQDKNDADVISVVNDDGDKNGDGDNSWNIRDRTDGSTDGSTTTVFDLRSSVSD